MLPKRLRPHPTAMETSGHDNGEDNPIEENGSFLHNGIPNLTGWRDLPSALGEPLVSACYLIPIIPFWPAHAKKRDESAINVR
ncbi:hypothetical protein M427DRAFT_59185, partial [Gonapodya prolifera JEL478]